MNDLPIEALNQMFNVNFFLVSQTNPHIAPVLNLKKMVNKTLMDVVEAEFKYRSATFCEVEHEKLTKCRANTADTKRVVEGKNLWKFADTKTWPQTLFY